MSLDIGKKVFWLCTKRRDLIFRNIQSAAEYVAEKMPKMVEEDGWEGFFERLVKVERRDDNWIVTGVSEEMWKQATLILWSKEREAEKELDEAKMAIVTEYDKYRGKT